MRAGTTSGGQRQLTPRAGALLKTESTAGTEYVGSLYRPMVIRVICCIRRESLAEAPAEQIAVARGNQKTRAQKKAGAAEIGDAQRVVARFRRLRGRSYPIPLQ